jgi:hypothetical protein
MPGLLLLDIYFKEENVSKNIIYIALLIICVIVIYIGYVVSAKACGMCPAEYIVNHCSYTSEDSACRCSSPCLSNEAFVVIGEFGLGIYDVYSENYWYNHLPAGDYISNANAMSNWGSGLKAVVGNYSAGNFDVYVCTSGGGCRVEDSMSAWNLIQSGYEFSQF